MTEWHEDPRERPPPVDVPGSELSPAALRGVVESFVLREGTDYGECDVPFETKVQQVLRQIERDEATIQFDPVTETVDIVVKRPLDRHRGGLEQQVTGETDPSSTGLDPGPGPFRGLAPGP